MGNEIVVSNASALIGLSIIKRLELLKFLYNEVLISQAVYREVVIEGEGEHGAEEVKKAIEDGWMKMVNVKDKIGVLALISPLSDGEAETIILALERNIPQVIMDERTARKKAEMMGLEVIGVLGILQLGIEEGISIDMKNDMDKLKEEGFRISNSLYYKIIE